MFDLIWMWCIPSRWHPSLYSVMLYASISSPILFNISIANWNLSIIDVNNRFFLYWRKHIDKRLHNSYWNPEINYTHFRYFLYSSPASRNIFLKTIYAQRSKILKHCCGKLGMVPYMETKKNPLMFVALCGS